MKLEVKISKTTRKEKIISAISYSILGKDYKKWWDSFL